jgi:hypothetical protein
VTFDGSASPAPIALLAERSFVGKDHFSEFQQQTLIISRLNKLLSIPPICIPEIWSDGIVRLGFTETCW